MKILKIENEVFEYHIYWILSEDKKEVSEYLLTEWIDSEKLDMSQWYTYITDRSDYIILHECIHIIQWLLDKKWIETGYKNTEVLAYNVDWAYRKLLKAYYKYKWNDKWKTY